jgi:hypothetical protein
MVIPDHADIGNLHAQRRRQVDLVILLIDENLPNQFRHRKFAELFALPNPGSIIPDRLVFALEIKSEHFLRIFGGSNGLGCYSRADSHSILEALKYHTKTLSTD